MVIATRSARRIRYDALELIASPQFGIFTWAQGIQAGFPPSTLARSIVDGTFRAVQPGAYSMQLGPLSLDAQRAAALISAGANAALTRRCALGLYECSRFARKQIQVGVSRRSARRLRDVDVSRTQAAAHGHVRTYRGHRVTSFTWTITDLGTELRPEQIAHVIHQGRLRRRFELHQLEEVLTLRGRFRGCAHVRTALEMYRAGSAGTRSHDEDVVYGWVRSMVRQPPLPNVHVRAGDQEFEVDIPFVSRRLCIEVDGPLHDDPAQRRRDQVRDTALRAAGFRVLRLHWLDIRDRPEWCKRRLRDALS